MKNPQETEAKVICETLINSRLRISGSDTSGPAFMFWMSKPCSCSVSSICSSDSSFSVHSTFQASV